MDFAYPIAIATSGRTATEGLDLHIRGMIEQLLLTNPGERVNRPDFGGGLYQLLFGPSSPELAATLQLTLQAAIQRYLSDVVAVQTLSVAAEDEVLRVIVNYVVRASGAASIATVELAVGGS